jgi:hypothetical protein
MWKMCRVPFWPIKPIFGIDGLLGVFAIVGVIFSLVMLIDCLKRPASRFYHPLTKEGEYDKLIWAAVIVLSLSFYFLGAIVYFFVVKKARAQSKEE